MKIVFVNGPARSGKDTLGDLAVQQLYPEVYAVKVKMANALKRALNAMLSFPVDNPDYAESFKDQPLPQLGGKTYRQGLIALSEQHVKTLYGEAFWGETLASELAQVTSPAQLYLISDSGFQKESLPILNLVGAENCLLVRMHREGKTFAGDSRGYIELPCETIDFHNNAGYDLIVDFIETVIKTWSKTNELAPGLKALFDRRPELGGVETNYIGNGRSFTIPGI